jgi:hypothetical protein
VLTDVLPGLRLFRYPEKWLGPLAFAVSALAALGCAQIERRGLARLGVVLAAVAVAELFAAGSSFLKTRLVPEDALSPPKFPWPALEAAGLSTHDRLLRLPTNGPLARSARDGEEAHNDALVRARQVEWNVQTLLGNNASRAGLQRVSGLSSFSFQAAEELWEAAAKAGAIARLADVLAARWVLTTPLDAEDFRKRPELAGLLPRSGPKVEWQTPLGELVLFERATALERAYVAEEAVAVVERREAMARLLAAEHDPHRRAVVELGTPDAGPGESFTFTSTSTSTFSSTESVSAPKPAPGIRFLDDEPCRVVVEIAGPVPAGAWLVLNDSFHPGWRAWVDGEEASVARANVFARGVALRPSSRRVEFRYEPPSLRVGAAVSTLAWTGILAGACVAWRRRRVSR